MHTALPYIDPKNKYEYPLLIVSPNVVAPATMESGLIVPDIIPADHEEGIVFACGQNSSFKQNDLISYKKIDRSKEDNYETANISGAEYDIIGEHEVWT